MSIIKSKPSTFYSFYSKYANPLSPIEINLHKPLLNCRLHLMSCHIHSLESFGSLDPSIRVAPVMLFITYQTFGGHPTDCTYIPVARRVCIV